MAYSLDEQETHMVRPNNKRNDNRNKLRARYQPLPQNHCGWRFDTN